jgi:hypothetical protein
MIMKHSAAAPRCLKVACMPEEGAMSLPCRTVVPIAGQGTPLTVSTGGLRVACGSKLNADEQS